MFGILWETVDNLGGERDFQFHKDLDNFSNSGLSCFRRTHSAFIVADALCSESRQSIVGFISSANSVYNVRECKQYKLCTNSVRRLGGGAVFMSDGVFIHFKFMRGKHLNK